MSYRLVLLLAGVTLVACTSKESKTTDSAAAGASATAAAPNVVTFTASDFAFEAPDTIPAGITTIRLVNRGPNLHHAQLLRFDQGKTLSDFLTTMKGMKPGDQPPMWAAPVGGPNPPNPGTESSVTQNLEPGSYAVVCFVDIPDKVPHIMKGMSHAFVVVPSTAPAAAEPASDVSLTLSDYKFDFSTPLTAGKHTIRVDNAGPQPHEIFIAKLDSGKTMEDVQKYAANYKGKMPAVGMGGIAAMLPNTHAFLNVDLPAGDYVLMCFVTDTKDGKPHLMHGMAQTIKIS